MEDARPDVVMVNAMVGGYEVMRMKERIERVTERVEARLHEQEDDEVRTVRHTSKGGGPCVGPSVPSVHASPTPIPIISSHQHPTRPIITYRAGRAARCCW